MKRRNFIRLVSLSGTGLILAQALPINVLADNTDINCFQPGPLIKICDDGSIIIYVTKQEMGQGVNASLPLIIAEELEVDLQDIKVEKALYDLNNAREYRTVGSSSVRGSWLPLRTAGAAAREMLIAAAAKEWNIAGIVCKAERGKVTNSLTGETKAYKDLIKTAITIPVPQAPVLKDYKDFKIIGKGKKKTNTLDIITGKTKYGMDVKVPGMLYAAVLRCPVYGGKIKSYDAGNATAIAGVKQIVELKEIGAGVYMRSGIAVVAENIWSALKARDALKVDWDYGVNGTMSSPELSRLMQQKANGKPDKIVIEKGDAPAAFKNSSNNIKATYELPFLAHATMEPLNCTAQFKDGKYELWGGFQVPGSISDILSAALNVKKEDITINLTLMGGGFGRRTKIDYVAEAALIAKATGKPVKLCWTRTDDIQCDFYRPASCHTLSASLDEQKKISSWQHHLVITPSSPFVLGQFQMWWEMLGGANGDLYYPVLNYKSYFTAVEPPVTCGDWRSIGFSYNNFVVESFIDEIAKKAGKDPLSFRLELLSGADAGNIEIKSFGQKIKYEPNRLANVLKMAAEKIGWHAPRKHGHFYGIACCPVLNAENSYAAHAFEISINTDKKITIHKVIAAIDCGIVIDPDGVKAQMEGSLVWGLSAALTGEITIDKGKVLQTSFNDYHILRHHEMPPLEVYIIESSKPPGGAGEIGVPSVAPAFINAITAAEGVRIRRLPISKSGYTV